MRISDWSSDVCSSDLPDLYRFPGQLRRYFLDYPVMAGNRHQFSAKLATENAASGIAKGSGQRAATQRRIDMDRAFGNAYGTRPHAGGEKPLATLRLAPLARPHPRGVEQPGPMRRGGRRWFGGEAR